MPISAPKTPATLLSHIHSVHQKNAERRQRTGRLRFHLIIGSVPASSPAIRPASAADLHAVRALSGQLGYPLGAFDAEQRLGTVLGLDNHALLVAETEGQVVGWVHGMMRPLLVEGPQVFIGGLVVEAGWRNRGIGEALMAAIEAWGREQGAQEVYVYSNILRARAHRFYARIGYEDHKTSKVFKKSLKG